MAVEPDAIRRGTVVVLRMAGDKARPAVVVRSDLLSGLGYATVLPITSEPRSDFSLRIDIPATPETGLRTPSQVMVDWPQTVRLSAMGEAIGHLDAAVMRAITRQLAIVLDIAAGARGASRTRGQTGIVRPSP